MKFRITLKDPDGFSDAIHYAAKTSTESIEGTEERSACCEIRQEMLWDFLENFVECQEYITLEVDTDKETVAVLKK